MVPRRRSPRLNSLAESAFSTSSSDDFTENDAPPQRKGTRGRPRKKKVEISGCESDTSSSKRRKSSRAAVAKKKEIKVESNKDDGDNDGSCLPRTRELSLKDKHDGGGTNLCVLGVDEAGRGPLAGPVVAAAAILPVDVPGITDSKKISKEEQREELYGKIIAAPGVRWAAAIVDAKRIDEINILQATMEAMKMATEAVVQSEALEADSGAVEVSVDRLGCYVVCGANDGEGKALDMLSPAADIGIANKSLSYYALVDGNRVPTDMPCEAEAMVKGDSREFVIGAASIIAKVTRDRLMNAYADMYPEYNLAQHKGYPTSAHMAAVRTHGASPIHRRTFAPLKHMTFDAHGKIVEDRN